MNQSKRLIGFLITVSGVAFTVGCGNSQPATTASNQPARDIGEVLAEVNGSKIGTNDFDEAYSRTVPRGPSEDTDESKLKQETMDRLVADELLYSEALKQGMDKDPKIKRMMINTLLRKDVYGSLKNGDISDEELQKYFEEHKDEFIVPEKVQVKRILIKVDDKTPDDVAKKKADGILGQLKSNPDSFKDVAIKESQDAYARRGGDIGFIPQDGKPGLDKKIVDEAFKLEPNSLSEVFKTDEGYNIIQVVNKRERVDRTFEQMKGAVMRKLKTEKSKAIQDQYIEDLKKSAKINVHQDKLASYTPTKKAAPAMGMPPGGMPGVAPGMPGPGGAAGAPPMPAPIRAEPPPAGEAGGEDAGHPE